MVRTRTLLSRRLGWAAAAGLAVLATAPPAGAETARVAITGSAFVPATATTALTAGEPGFPQAHGHVIFTNQDVGIQHTVTFDDVRLVSSGPLATGQMHDAVFAVAGTYPYRCTIHPGMTGSVVVNPAAPPTSTAAAPTRAAPDAGSGGGGGAVVLIGAGVMAAVAAAAWFLLRRRAASATTGS